MGFNFTRLQIPEVILIEPDSVGDDRGFFMETYRKSEFAAAGVRDTFVQDNWSHSRRGVLRGLHYQKNPLGQAKLVMVVSGEVFDVAVDIRKGSATFGRYVAVNLSSQNFRILYVPVGFAHGFCVLSVEADFLYKVSAPYSPEHDRGIVWNDPSINIPWPIDHPILSVKDANLPLLGEADINF
ncbi:dTDP-4-dehydrorhamnose 3,5-epimerase [candidate division KSB1 bacterium]|nr:dTDP-4-dehydrorhamnose 3,5-epimerase [candidate division KSB1 bacterium]